MLVGWNPGVIPGGHDYFNNHHCASIQQVNAAVVMNLPGRCANPTDQN